MPDTFSTQERSAIMRSVKSKGNKTTELALIAIFKELGIKGWRRGYQAAGRPDFAFVGKKIAVFVDGCFWHGHGCRKMPQSNSVYWTNKIEKNKQRDKCVTAVLKSRGWFVIRIWECELSRKKRDVLMEKLNVILEKI